MTLTTEQVEFIDAAVRSFREHLATQVKAHGVPDETRENVGRWAAALSLTDRVATGTSTN